MTCEIDLEDDDPEIVRLAIQHLYNGDYPDGRCVIYEVVPKLSPSPSSIESEYAAPPVTLNHGHHTTTLLHQFLQVFRPPLKGLSYYSLMQFMNNDSNQGVRPATLQLTSWYSTSSRKSSTIEDPLSKVEFASVSVLPRPGQAIITYVKVYVFAEKYDIQPLKSAVRRKCFEVASMAWNTSAFIQSLKLIYDGTPQTTKTNELRETAIKIAAEHTNELVEIEDFVTLCEGNGQITTKYFLGFFSTVPEARF